jgi:hypothetical protein
MKKLLIICLISSSLLFVWCFNQETIPEIKNQNVENVQSWVVQIWNVESNSWVNEQTSTWTIYESWTKDNSWTISNTKIKNSITFSDIQIKDILAKIDENSNIQQEINKNSTWSLIQWDFKAEYIAPKDYSKDTDNIIVNIWWKKYVLPWAYWKEDIADIIKCTKLQKDIKIEDIKHNGDCPFWSLVWFRWFSPSWKYLLYTAWAFETGEDRLIDTKNWKIVLKYPEILTYAWTPDKTQFIYGGASWMSSWPW